LKKSVDSTESNKHVDPEQRVCVYNLGSISDATKSFKLSFNLMQKNI